MQKEIQRNEQNQHALTHPFANQILTMTKKEEEADEKELNKNEEERRGHDKVHDEKNNETAEK